MPEDFSEITRESDTVDIASIVHSVIDAAVDQAFNPIYSLRRRPRMLRNPAMPNDMSIHAHVNFFSTLESEDDSEAFERDDLNDDFRNAGKQDMGPSSTMLEYRIIVPGIHRTHGIIVITSARVDVPILVSLLSVGVYHSIPAAIGRRFMSQLPGIFFAQCSNASALELLATVFSTTIG